MKRRGERREGRGQLEKLPELISHLTLQTKCPISPPASPFLCPSLPSLGQSACQMWSQFSPSPPPPRIKMHWLLKSGVDRTWPSARLPKREARGASRRSINQAAKRTPEKVPSKQTDLSHDSRGTAGPHRSQPATLSQWEYSAERTMQSCGRSRAPTPELDARLAAAQDQVCEATV